jgi:hypothetical protein
MLVILHRLKQFSAADVASLRTELVELCGENLLDVVAVIINNREVLSAEFQVLIDVQIENVFCSKGGAEAAYEGSQVLNSTYF